MMEAAIVIVMALIVLAVLITWLLTIKKLKNDSSIPQETRSPMDYKISRNSYTENRVETRRRNQPVRKTPTQNNQVVSDRDNSSDFTTSLAVAYATDSALLGTMVGGDPIGAMIGDSLNHSDDSSNHSSWDSSDSSNHSSWDSSDSSNHSSWDSSDSSSNDSSWSSSDSSSWDSSSSFD